MLKFSFIHNCLLLEAHSVARAGHQRLARVGMLVHLPTTHFQSWICVLLVSTEIILPLEWEEGFGGIRTE
jgi:hypothetical protein